MMKAGSDREGRRRETIATTRTDFPSADTGRRGRRAPDILDRTRAFAVRIIALCDALPDGRAATIIGTQILRSGMSVGAQLREAKRSRSDAEMISKIESALQELEETLYWFEVLVESGKVKPGRIADLSAEADEIVSILVTSVRTLKRRRR